MKIIGISGLAGSGKDTAYEILKQELELCGYNTKKLSFAQKLKDVCCLLFGWDLNRLYNDADYKEGTTLDDGSIDMACELLNKSRRVVMQEIGTDAMRDNFHKDIWIITMKLAINNGEFSGCDYGFITDMRFLNEIDFVKSMGGKCVRVNRVGENTTLTSETDHASEHEWQEFSEWDHIVENKVDSNLSKRENMENFKTQLMTVLRD